MAASNNALERIIKGLLLCAALLAFFFPLANLHVPVIGDQPGDVYNFRGGLTLLDNTLGSFAALGTTDNPGTSTHPVAENVATTQPMEMPLSLRITTLLPWIVFAAMACTALALLDLLSFQRGVTTLSLAGGCFGALAVVHLMAMSSGLRSWTEQAINSGALGSADNPVLTTRILMLDTFHVSPGAGLYLLTGCLFLVPLLSYTHAIPRVKSVLRRNPRINVSQPVHIRPLNSRHPAETCASVNLSQYGLYVESPSSHYYAGMEVYVTRNAYSADPAKKEEHGSVVRVEKREGGKCRIAIRIIPEA